jgi:flagellar motility protein MotE (MotC chaperone)
MKSDQLALVLANMNADNAKALTVKLANKLMLPETTSVPAPAATPIAAAAPAAAGAPAAPASAAQNPATPKT